MSSHNLLNLFFFFCREVENFTFPEGSPLHDTITELARNLKEAIKEIEKLLSAKEIACNVAKKTQSTFETLAELSKFPRWRKWLTNLTGSIQSDVTSILYMVEMVCEINEEMRKKEVSDGIKRNEEKIRELLGLDENQAVIPSAEAKIGELRNKFFEEQDSIALRKAAKEGVYISLPENAEELMAGIENSEKRIAELLKEINDINLLLQALKKLRGDEDVDMGERLKKKLLDAWKECLKSFEDFEKNLTPRREAI